MSIVLLALRVLRWALWLGFLGYSVYFVTHRPLFFNHLGHLLHSTELVLFGLPVREKVDRSSTAPLADLRQ
jgi:hypothetical protein